MPQTPPSRIEYRNGSNALIAEAVADADGLTLRAFDGQGGLMAYVQVSPLGRLDVSTGGGVLAMDADGKWRITGATLAFEVGLDLPTSDPLMAGWPWNDGGTVKVSNG